MYKPVILGVMDRTFDPELDEVVRASDRPTYNTAAVEQRTGIPPATFRAWERRYGFPKPHRLPGNQRLYSDQDVAAIGWLHRRTGQGLAISHAIGLLLDRLAAGPVPRSSPTTGRPLAALADDLGRTLLAFDALGAEAVLAEAFGLYSVEEVCLQIVQPMLVEVGERWHRGELSVAAEHFATGFVRRKLFGLFSAAEPGRGRGLIFAACAPDDWHEIGVLTVSLFLARRGFRVSYLGPSLAPDGLAETLTDHRPDLLLISATTDESAGRVGEIVAALQRVPELRPRLAYGGQPFPDPARREAIDGVYLGPDAASAAATDERLAAALAQPETYPATLAREAR